MGYKMDLKEVGSDAGDWIDLAQDRDQWHAYVRPVINLQILQKLISQLVCVGVFYETLLFLGSIQCYLKFKKFVTYLWFCFYFNQ